MQHDAPYVHVRLVTIRAAAAVAAAAIRHHDTVPKRSKIPKQVYSINMTYATVLLEMQKQAGELTSEAATRFR